jgi:tetratricopeptide (TPR) repeat protein
LVRDPQHLPLAVVTARAAIERARLLGDPRELGLAQAALAPWWSMAQPPAAARLLRATILQSQHRFDAALSDLTALLQDRSAPLAVQAQAGLTQVAVLQVTGRLNEAAQACASLRPPRFDALGPALSVPARACAAELRSVRGQSAQAAAELAQLAREAPDDRWLALLRAELAQRMGDDAAALARFREAVEGNAEVYAIAAYADWLLDRGRDRAVLELLRAHDAAADADALALRRAIALRRLNDPLASAAASALEAQFDAARQRGENLHAREEARLALDVWGQPERALHLARDNWTRQKELADAVLLLRAAIAAGQPSAADVLRTWTSEPAAIDVRLAAIARPPRP